MSANKTTRLAEILAKVEAQSTYAGYQNASREIDRLNLQEDEIHSQRRVRMGILSSSTIEPLIAYLKVDCYRMGLFPQFYVASYGRTVQEIMNPGSGLYEFKPEVVWITLDVEALVPGTVGIDSATQVDSILRRLDELIKNLRKNTTTFVVLSTFVPLDVRPFMITPDPLQVFFQNLNMSLFNTYKDDSHVLILDLDSLASYHGRSRAVNPTLRYLAGMRMSETFLPIVSQKCVGVLRALKGLARKCLVLDLDNTLWGGIVGEVGLEGIDLGPEPPGNAYVHLQHVILRLRESGVLLAINSKNNLDDALAVLREHPHMVLRENHFSSIQIDWDLKTKKMERIAKELNIGIDSLVFVDDDPVERKQMATLLPEVLTLDMPRDPARFPQVLLELNVFEQLGITKEDSLRGEFYAAEQEREIIRQQSDSFEDFLRSLDLVASIRIAQAGDVARIAQMTQKTNQFNLTTRRYSPAEIACMISRSDCRVYALCLRDVFGDYGLTALAIVKVSGTDWFVDSFLMSCRIIGRKIETVFLNEIVADAKRSAIKHIVGEYLSTGKNSLVSEFYSNEGFASTDGGHIWRLDLSERVNPLADWVKIER